MNPLRLKWLLSFLIIVFVIVFWNSFYSDYRKSYEELWHKENISAYDTLEEDWKSMNVNLIRVNLLDINYLSNLEARYFDQALRKIPKSDGQYDIYKFYKIFGLNLEDGLIPRSPKDPVTPLLSIIYGLSTKDFTSTRYQDHEKYKVAILSSKLLLKAFQDERSEIDYILMHNEHLTRDMYKLMTEFRSSNIDGLSKDDTEVRNFWKYEMYKAFYYLSISIISELDARGELNCKSNTLQKAHEYKRLLNESLFQQVTLGTLSQEIAQKVNTQIGKAEVVITKAECKEIF